ncbi:MAG: efflux RND transporter periplasmic adaptor subunit, partial [Pseudomonadota bacterium]|nr:efflux RND transporter periplasmic adaptor subunit [Pseudomonadota bacterium]
AAFVVILGALAVFGYRAVVADRGAAEATPAAAAHRAENISFAANAPELSSLKINAVSAVALPLADALNGRITYDENLTTRISAPIQGRVTALHAEIGDPVARGAVLAELDSPDLATAEADWRKAQADQVRKNLALQRARTLFEGEVLARKDLESAQADFQQAAAETRRTVLRMKNLNAGGREDGRFVLQSPIAGIVVDRQINPGQEVRPDLPNPLFVVTDFSRLWVVVDVPERSAATLHRGQHATIDTDAWPEQHFDAVIDRVGLALDPATRRIQVRCTVRNPERKLKPEMFARVSFLPGDGSLRAFPVPNTSLFSEGVYSYLFVETAAHTFERRRVNVTLRGRERSYVDNGLHEGDRIVTEGAFLLNAEVAGDAK